MLPDGILRSFGIIRLITGRGTRQGEGYGEAQSEGLRTGSRCTLAGFNLNENAGHWPPLWIDEAPGDPGVMQPSRGKRWLAQRRRDTVLESGQLRRSVSE